MKILKKIGIALAIVIVLCILTVIFAMIRLYSVDKSINDDITSIFSNTAYAESVAVEDFGVIEQEISCGYACIQLFAEWKDIDLTEQDLYDEYGTVVTSTGQKFCEEMNKRFPQYTTTMYKNLKNTELIDYLYKSLANGMPVTCELAAQKGIYEEDGESGSEWALHYVVVTEMDIENDKITVSNPYGYIEIYTVESFLEATRFASYENMPVSYSFAFAFGIFEKNTIFITE